jgi:protein-S-isoprenylcysteine O-methyltransferase Ste14
VAGTVKAQADMGHSWRVGVDEQERTDLVTSGSFAHVRNPIFTCLALVGLGTAMAARTPGAALGAGILVAGIQTQVRLVEEPYLRRTHGEAFDRYAGAVGRFVPGVGRLG